MGTATTEHLDALRRRIDRLEADANRARERNAAVDESLEQLENELELAEHRVALELAETKAQFADALEAELRSWDTYLERTQTRAAAKTGASRERAEAAIADLRRRRVSLGQSHAEVGAAAGEGWRDTKRNVLAELDELKSKADTERLNSGGDA